MTDSSPSPTPRALLDRSRLTYPYVVLVIVAGAVLLVRELVATPQTEWFGHHPLAYAVFAILLVVAEARPMTYLVDGGEVTASWTFAFALLFVAPPAACLFLVAVSSCGIDLARGKPLVRALFNGSQFVVSLFAGILAGRLVGDLVLAAGTEPTIRWLVAAAVASAVAFVANSTLISVVIALQSGLPVAEILRRSFGVSVAMDGTLLAMAPVFAVIGLNAWILIPLLLVTVWIIFRSASIALNNRHEATHDLLTEIPNRRLFEDHAALLLAGAGNSGGKAAVIHLDLDGFKGINDRLGHYYGDLVLKQVAMRLRDNRRAIDHVARLGGDEFAVLLGRIDNDRDAFHIAERLLAALEAPMDVEGVPLKISASLGVAIYPEHGEDLTTLMKSADLATYEAKDASTNVALFTRSDDGKQAGKLSLLSELAGAIEADELSVVYQPKADIGSGRITGVEALIRWHHPARGEILPGRFMPQAEQTDLMGRITEYVLEQSIRQCVAWQDEGLRVPVAVNTSARSLHDLRFPTRLQELLDQYHLDPGWLELEITENAVMGDPTRTASVLGHLQALGVSISIDDFGTGYSSLATLRNLTIDAIKIDKSFVTSLAGSASDLSIASSVIELGHNLGLQVVAEGVETVEVLDTLRALHCDQYQGYLLGRALPPTALRPLLERGGAAPAASSVTEVVAEVVPTSAGGAMPPVTEVVAGADLVDGGDLT